MHSKICPWRDYNNTNSNSKRYQFPSTTTSLRAQIQTRKIIQWIYLCAIAFKFPDMEGKRISRWRHWGLEKNAIWEVFKCLRERKSSYIKLECGVECLFCTLCNFLLKGQVDCHPTADVSCALCLVIPFNLIFKRSDKTYRGTTYSTLIYNKPS
jgi:hypothetical protein